MKISYLHIKNFKSIRELEIKDMENALILVGKNNTGKTTIIDAIRAVSGDYLIKKADYLEPERNIIIGVKVLFNKEDMLLFHQKGIVSKYKRYDLWEKDFRSKLPSYQDGELFFECIIRINGTIRYYDGARKNNPYIKNIFPKNYYIDHNRNIEEIQNEVLKLYDKNSIYDLQENICVFNQAKSCTRCFNCIGIINRKMPAELSILETARLMEYKLFHMNITEFSNRVNRYFHANGTPSRDIQFVIKFNIDDILKITTKVYNKERETFGSIDTLSEGLKSIYVLSLLEAYIDEEGTIPCIILIEDPEIFLHPYLQKMTSEILYRLSKKNQVIFSTHSPNMIFNFSTKQIKQVVLDKEYYTVVKQKTDINEILNDLGYTANDLINVNFVFIVEGKQDSTRLPLLLEKYYSEIYDSKGKLQRISIIQTNSCTNIKTYANLKYINQLYLKNQFLMIRDGDGANPDELISQLCHYYRDREREDSGNLPRIMPYNVLILKYYSFENYFLEPKVMQRIGIIENEEDFYSILYEKYTQYLYRLKSTKKMLEKTKIHINSKKDLKEHIEEIKIYVRGHNLFDIFYAKYKGEKEKEILQQYINLAPRETFKDILEAIDQFIYFENRRKRQIDE